MREGSPRRVTNCHHHHPQRPQIPRHQTRNSRPSQNSPHSKTHSTPLQRRLHPQNHRSNLRLGTPILSSTLHSRRSPPLLLRSTKRRLTNHPRRKHLTSREPQANPRNTMDNHRAKQENRQSNLLRQPRHPPRTRKTSRRPRKDRFRKHRPMVRRIDSDFRASQRSIQANRHSPIDTAYCCETSSQRPNLNLECRRLNNKIRNRSRRDAIPHSSRHLLLHAPLRNRSPLPLLHPSHTRRRQRFTEILHDDEMSI